MRGARRKREGIFRLAVSGAAREREEGETEKRGKLAPNTRRRFISLASLRSPRRFRAIVIARPRERERVSSHYLTNHLITEHPPLLSLLRFSNRFRDKRARAPRRALRCVRSYRRRRGAVLLEESRAGLDGRRSSLRS